MDIEVFKKTYGIDAKKVVSLRDNVAFFIDNSDVKKIFKRRRTSAKGNWINNHRFFNEMRIYKSLKASDFKFLHTPQLINSNDDSLLLQYIERSQETKTSIDEFIGSYIELQTLEVPKKFWFDFQNQLLRGFYYKGVIVPLFTLRQKLGLLKTLQIIGLFLKLNFTQKKLKSHYWLHGDLTRHNVYNNTTDNKLYFIDFENMFYTRKWILAEVIPRCLKYQPGQFTFDNKYLKRYMNTNNVRVKYDLQKINLKDQVRFAMLMVCITIIAASKSEPKRKFFIKILKRTLNRKLFNKWYELNIIPSLNEVH